MTAVSIVIPAHDEQANIGRCLESVLDQDADVSLRVIVAANRSSDDTAAVAEAHRDRFARAGHALHVLEVDTGGKPDALNAADALAEGCIVYLDADVVLSPDAIRAMVDALAPATAASPRLVAPRMIMGAEGASRLARSYLAVWTQLPAVRDDVLGAGCYAVNPEGRGRWDRFPDLIADDAFVRSQFSADERVVVGGSFTTEFPDRQRLVPVLQRWAAGNRQLEAAGFTRAGASAWDNMATLGRPPLWRHVPAFLLVTATVRLRRSPAPITPAWSRR